MKRVSLLIILLVLVLSGCGQQNSSVIPPHEYKAQLEASEDAVLIDVRTPGEYNDEHLSSAVNIDYNSEKFKENIRKLDKDGTYFIYCRSGNRSGRAMKIMKDLGFEQVTDLKGGILEWKKHDMPLVKED